MLAAACAEPVAVGGLGGRRRRARAPDNRELHRGQRHRGLAAGAARDAGRTGSATAPAARCSATTRPTALVRPRRGARAALRRGGRRRSSTSTTSRPTTWPSASSTPSDADRGHDAATRRHRATAGSGGARPMHALSVDLAERSYPVLVGAGARHEVARFVPPGGQVGRDRDPGGDRGRRVGRRARPRRALRGLRHPRRRGRQDARHGRGARPRASPGPGCPAPTSSSPSAAASSPTWPGSPPPPTTGARPT